MKTSDKASSGCPPRAARVAATWLGSLLLLAFSPSPARADDAAESSGHTTSEVDSAASDDASPAAAETAVPESYGPKPRLTARLRVEYDYRSTGGDKDTDLLSYFYGNARDLREGRLDLYASARLHADLDQPASDAVAEDPYQSVDDSNGVTDNRLLQLYGDLHGLNKRWALRGGRQYVDIADYLHLDGAQLMLGEDGRLGGRAYFGRPVSYYSSTSGDYAGGLSLIGRPWEGNRTRLTVSQFHDDSEEGTDLDYYLDVRQELTEETRLRGQASVLNDQFRMGRFDLFYFSEDGETDFSLGGSYWGNFDAETVAYSPLYNVLGEQDPYTFAYARLTQLIAPSWSISPGVSLRYAENGDNPYNNRDYQDYDVTLTYEPTRAFSTSLSLEYWAVENDDSFLGLSGEVRYRHGRVWEVSGGAAFAQYSYDTYSDLSYTANGGQTVFTENGTVIEESPYVYTYFLRAKWKVSRTLTLRLQGDIEDDDSAPDLAYWGRGSVEVRY